GRAGTDQPRRASAGVVHCWTPLSVILDCVLCPAAARSADAGIWTTKHSTADWLDCSDARAVPSGAPAAGSPLPSPVATPPESAAAGFELATDETETLSGTSPVLLTVNGERCTTPGEKVVIAAGSVAARLALPAVTITPAPELVEALR